MAKKLFLIITMCLCGVLFVSAQNQNHGRHQGRDRQQMWKDLQEFKMKFLAQEMDLKEDQKDRFVELYNEMSQARMSTFNEVRGLEKKVKDAKGKASDEDYKALSEAMEKAKAKDAEIEKQYDDKFAEFLTSKQIYQLKQAEGKFRDKMTEMRGKRGRQERQK